MSITPIIRNRRAVFPNHYDGTEIPESTIAEILENANWAPTHRRTEPWRFQVFVGEGRQHLSDYLGGAFLAKNPGLDKDDPRYTKVSEKPLQSAAVIAIIMHRDPEERIPEWEEIAAVSCAVQNMWLSCTDKGIGGYWSTPEAMLKADQFLQLAENERCLGIFYMGNWDQRELPAKRGDIEEKVKWIRE